MKHGKLLITFLILFQLIPLPAAAETANASNYSQIQMNATGIIKIITIPVDGAIYIDSTFAGSGLYYNASFPAGVYRVSFGAMEGYGTPENQTINVTAGLQTSLIVQYVATVITPPELKVTKEVSSSSVSMDETLDIIIKIKNTGSIRASMISLNDSIPDCMTYLRGDKGMSGGLDAGESRIIDYAVRPARAGLCILNPASVSFSDPSGNRFTRYSDEVRVTVSPKPSREPHLVVEKNVDRSNALVDEGVVITLKLKNDGAADATGIYLLDEIPGCAVLSQGGNFWNGDLKPDEEKILTYIINVNKPGLCSLDAARANYSDLNGNEYRRYSQPLNIYVREKSVSQVLDPVVTPLIIIGTAIGSLLTIITVYKSLSSKLKKENDKQEK